MMIEEGGRAKIFKYQVTKFAKTPDYLLFAMIKPAQGFCLLSVMTDCQPLLCIRQR